MATPESSVFHRRAWYVALAISWGLALTLLNPMGSQSRSGQAYAIWSMVWSGVFCAAPFLLAVWLALGVQPAVRRVPMALALACFFVLVTLAGQQATMRDELTTPVFAAVALTVFSLPLAIARKWMGWRVRVPGVEYSQRDRQFTIVTILVWTAVAGGLLGMANWVVGDWRPQLQFFTGWILFRGLVMMSVISLIMSPVAIAATGAVLADWPRHRFAGWLIALFSCYSMGFGTILYLMLIGGGGPAQGEAFEMASIPMLVLCGLVGAIVVTLGGLRSCGVRLWREGQRALGEESREVA